MQGLALKVQHVFSCEMDPRKRELLLKEHRMLHLFEKCEDFRDGHGYCYVCKCDHPIDKEHCAIYIFQAGPACTNLSRESSIRSKYAGCYSEAKGASGPTYLFGFRKAARNSWFLKLPSGRAIAHTCHCPVRERSRCHRANPGQAWGHPQTCHRGQKICGLLEFARRG